MKLIDRLYAVVAEKGHVCVGLDTDLAYIPEAVRGTAEPEEVIFTFNREIIDATADVAAVYKVQIAYYEALGLEGLRAYVRTLAYLREKGAIVIADVKRGDIAKTAEMYAAAHFSGDFEADFITANPFMGMDTLSPFYPYLAGRDKGLFALVSTSNPGAMDVEGIETPEGTVSERLAEMLAVQAAAFEGACGYSAVGAVVGCTDPLSTQRMRALMPRVFF
ncbi:MAG: orotidine-5'-phosphate decarboxylase, partial [Clostridiales bacterium]|nr:orotidine-5'-phosphate decarboxylase [Clostridiales bacterium]